MAPKTEIVKPGASALTQIEQVPEFLQTQVGHTQGMEDVDQSDILIPRLGLCQALSPQKRKSHASYIESLSEGQLFNTVTGEIYGESLEVFLLFFFKNRIKYFPIADGGGIDCISVNALTDGRLSPDGCILCRFSKFGNGEEAAEGERQDPPLCTLYHNLMSFIPASNSPIAISFKSTGLSVTKQLLAQIRMSCLPMYAKKYKVEVTTKRDGDNEWFEKKIISTGFVNPDQFKEMEGYFKLLKEANIKLDTTGEEGTDFNEPYHTDIANTEL